MTSVTRHRLTRKQLYDLVWSEPVSKIAPRYNISDVGFAKLCRREDVPLPPRGYWAKLKFGKKVPKPRLKPRENPEAEIVVIADRPPVERPELPADITTATDHEQLDEARIIVPKSVSTWHPIIEKWFEDDRRRDTAWPGSSRSAIRLTSLERRRRTLLTVFFRALERRGWKLTAESHEKFTVKMVGQTITFEASEVIKQKRIPITAEDRQKRYYSSHETDRLEHQPTGLLRLRLYKYYGSNRDWVESEDRPLESRLNDAIVGMLQEAARDREREEKWAEERRQDEIRAQARREAEERVRREKQQIDKLIADANRWETSNRVRAYVQHARKAECPPIDDGQSIDEWVGWALVIANRLDPTKE
jgi:hypothetical protein